MNIFILDRNPRLAAAYHVEVKKRAKSTPHIDS